MDRGELLAKIAQMREASMTIRNSANRVSQSVENADNEIRALGLDRYTSDAAEVFRAEYQRLTPRLREASRSLLLFQEKLALSADEIEVASRPIE